MYIPEEAAVKDSASRALRLWWALRRVSPALKMRRDEVRKFSGLSPEFRLGDYSTPYCYGLAPQYILLSMDFGEAQMWIKLFAVMGVANAHHTY